MTADILIQTLSQLGADSDAIAKTLSEKGVTGSQRCGDSCPVANYLRTCGFDAPCVAETSVSADGTKIPTPDSIRDFVYWFDMGYYPDLIRKKGDDGET